LCTGKKKKKTKKKKKQKKKNKKQKTKNKKKINGCTEPPAQPDPACKLADAAARKVDPLPELLELGLGRTLRLHRTMGDPCHLREFFIQHRHGRALLAQGRRTAKRRSKIYK
jgi:hypothetical protein